MHYITLVCQRLDGSDACCRERFAWLSGSSASLERCSEIAERTRAAQRLRSRAASGEPGQVTVIYCHILPKTTVQQQQPLEQPGEGRSPQRQAA
ncbi:hypothetical protein KTAU_14730 [Thermogemmatispora aurantia]|uniref:Uncharacterized protein n=1 Tax=Thermogemmatispora aurantia TaxID=2045279 RepID=A0A5J4K9N8_9CHLR|nr:hypothetical protein KTAU_14730 [Thermogemmatispora aurantia]